MSRNSPVGRAVRRVNAEQRRRTKRYRSVDGNHVRALVTPTQAKARTLGSARKLAKGARRRSGM